MSQEESKAYFESPSSTFDVAGIHYVIWKIIAAQWGRPAGGWPAQHSAHSHQYVSLHWSCSDEYCVDVCATARVYWIAAGADRTARSLSCSGQANGLARTDRLHPDFSRRDNPGRRWRD